MVAQPYIFAHLDHVEIVQNILLLGMIEPFVEDPLGKTVQIQVQSVDRLHLTTLFIDQRSVRKDTGIGAFRPEDQKKPS
ncbi:Small ribosomal subunit protein [Trichinella spiralis]|uniref:Small ribosomal subunit protein n=1 Tax=Trichinella spiralis TaxID=6334 RepID=A0ABR3KHQ1_TRISP